MVCGEEFLTECIYCRYFAIACLIAAGVPSKAKIKCQNKVYGRAVRARRRFAANCYAEVNGTNLSLRADGSRFLSGRRLRVRNHGFPVATLLYASPHHPNFGLLLHDKRRAAFRARLRERHMRRGEVTIGIPRATVENSRSSTATLSGASATHKFAFIALRAFDAHGDGPRVLAFRVAGASDELTEAAVFLDQAVRALRALLIQWLVRLMRDACSRD